MRTTLMPILTAAAVLAGCAATPSAPSVMVLPGTQKTAAQFNGDNAGCQDYARSLVAPGADAANTQAVGSAVVGTALGAAVGALLGSGYYYHNSAAAWGAGTGLMVGSAIGGSQAQAAGYGLQQRYDAAYVQCMYQRGHQVPGQPAYRPAPAVPAPRPAPRYPPPGYPAPNIPPPNTPPPV
jgi:outer membrane lipoprotein SlyB